MWGQLGTSQADVDYAVLEDEFAAKQAVKQIGRKGPGGPQRPKQAMLLPLQRAQNVGVFLTRLKMGPAQVGSTPTSGCTSHMAALPKEERHPSLLCSAKHMAWMCKTAALAGVP